jgi:hypothetical protein
MGKSPFSENETAVAATFQPALALDAKGKATLAFTEYFTYENAPPAGGVKVMREGKKQGEWEYLGTPMPWNDSVTTLSPTLAVDGQGRPWTTLLVWSSAGPNRNFGPPPWEMPMPRDDSRTWSVVTARYEKGWKIVSSSQESGWTARPAMAAAGGSVCSAWHSPGKATRLRCFAASE